MAHRRPGVRIARPAPAWDTVLRAEQDETRPVDGADDLAVDLYMRMGDALDDGSHAVILTGQRPKRPRFFFFGSTAGVE